MTKIKRVKNQNVYMRYVPEPSNDEIFLTRKFKGRIIFKVKISRSTVGLVSHQPLTRCVCEWAVIIHYNYSLLAYILKSTGLRPLKVGVSLLERRQLRWQVSEEADTDAKQVLYYMYAMPLIRLT